MYHSKEQKLNEILKTIDENIEFLPDILSHASMRLTQYKNQCEKKNNNKMVNALGSACQLLAMKRKPTDMKRACILIEQAQFPHGLESWHHEGEKNFYNKFLRQLGGTKEGLNSTPFPEVKNDPSC